MDRGVLTQKGFALSVSDMWNSSPFIVLICPLKTVGNSFIISSGVGVGFLWTGVARVVSVGCLLLVGMLVGVVVSVGCG